MLRVLGALVVLNITVTKKKSIFEISVWFRNLLSAYLFLLQTNDINNTNTHTHTNTHENKKRISHQKHNFYQCFILFMVYMQCYLYKLIFGFQPKTIGYENGRVA